MNSNSSFLDKFKGRTNNIGKDGLKGLLNPNQTIEEKPVLKEKIVPSKVQLKPLFEKTPQSRKFSVPQRLVHSSQSKKIKKNEETPNVALTNNNFNSFNPYIQYNQYNPYIIHPNNQFIHANFPSPVYYHSLIPNHNTNNMIYNPYLTDMMNLNLNNNKSSPVTQQLGNTNILQSQLAQQPHNFNENFINMSTLTKNDLSKHINNNHSKDIKEIKENEPNVNIKEDENRSKSVNTSKINYKPYTLKDYKDLIPTMGRINKGGLGANIGGEDWEKRQDRIRKMKDFQIEVKQKNYGLFKTEEKEKEKGKEKDKSKRVLALEYCKYRLPKINSNNSITNIGQAVSALNENEKEEIEKRREKRMKSENIEKSHSQMNHYIESTGCIGNISNIKYIEEKDKDEQSLYNLNIHIKDDISKLEDLSPIEEKNNEKTKEIIRMNEEEMDEELINLQKKRVELMNKVEKIKESIIK